MPGTANQHLKALFILKILDECTDEKHPLTAAQIIEKLDSEYGIECERKSLYRHINSLCYAYGADIIFSKEEPKGYYTASRKFENTELRLLIDAVESSTFISYKKSRTLIEKLSQLAGPYAAEKLLSQVRMRGINKTDNELLYYTLDEILNAIENKKRIEFSYFEYGPDKKKRYRNDGKRYLVSPYALVWDDEKYYLHAYHEKYDRISSFRVDMMEGVETTDLPRLKEEQYQNYDASKRTSFDQFAGEKMIVELVALNALSSVVIDRFGERVDMRKNDDNTFVFRAEVEMSPAFLSWVFSFGNKMYISFPNKARKTMADYIKSVSENYGEF